jgi:hypothetical protein
MLSEMVQLEAALEDPNCDTRAVILNSLFYEMLSEEDKSSLMYMNSELL